ncbi:MAG: flagellin [Alphaproteobacteria bacterium]|jgi:flagellin
MALNIISNFAANVTHRNLVKSDMELTSSLTKISSGTRVVSAKDDAASLAIGSRLAAEVSALRQAQVNAGQAVSMLQVADGAMARAQDILLRMKSLAVQSGSGQLSGTERGLLDTEYQALVSEIDRLASDTSFNGNTLVNGAIDIALDSGTSSNYEVRDGIQDITLVGDHGTATAANIDYDPAGSFTVTISGNDFTGALSTDTNDGSTMSTGTVVTLSNALLTESVEVIINTAFDVDATPATEALTLTGTNTTTFTYKIGTGTSPTSDEITVSLDATSASSLGLNSTNITSESQADISSVAISNAVDQLNNARAGLGASQNRLEFAAANIATTLENTEAARSNLLDLDIASEMSIFTSKQILVQAGVAMLAQANQAPQVLLKLLQ